MPQIIKIFFLLLLTVSTARCTRELSQCDGPAVDLSKVLSLKKSLFSSGNKAYLVVPNPIDASGSAAASATSSNTLSSFGLYNLSDLLTPSRLESAFLKIRLRSIDDAANLLAAPNSKGDFAFPLTDSRYWQTMGYYSVNSTLKYVEALGFSLVKNRPLYVFVNASEPGKNEINAFYEHNYLDPSQPRKIKLFGEGNYATAVDRDIFSHEAGHYINESVSHEVGFDFAVDNGAVYTPASSLHECLADYIAESTGNQPHIGKWIARNFTGYEAGQPLRSAVDDGKSLEFSKVMANDGTGQSPERYTVGEWCSRVLWDLREQFVKEDASGGAVFADRLVLSAVALLSKDTSFPEFRDSLITADEQLHCGLHQKSIRSAFERRGMPESYPSLASPLTLQAQAIGISSAGNVGQPTAGAQLSFKVTITNPNNDTARDVRLRLESSDPNLHLMAYMQGFGDIPAGKQLRIGTSSQGGLPIEFSVSAEIDQDALTGKKIPFKLRLTVQNGPETVHSGEITP